MKVSTAISPPLSRMRASTLQRIKPQRLTSDGRDRAAERGGRLLPHTCAGPVFDDDGGVEEDEPFQRGQGVAGEATSSSVTFDRISPKPGRTTCTRSSGRPSLAALGRWRPGGRATSHRPPVEEVTYYDRW